MIAIILIFTLNLFLGNFILSGIEPKKSGRPRIQVSFNVDANGMLGVEATDLDTGRRQGIEIEGSQRLSFSEISNLRFKIKLLEENRSNKSELTEKQAEFLKVYGELMARVDEVELLKVAGFDNLKGMVKELLETNISNEEEVDWDESIERLKEINRKFDGTFYALDDNIKV